MPTQSPAPAGLPDTDTLRRHALARSWQRDRTVARRRLVWRWTLWLTWRYGLPAAALAAAGGTAWWLHQRGAAEAAAVPAAVAPAALPAPVPASSIPAVPRAELPPAEPPVPAPVPATATPPAAALRLDWQPVPAPDIVSPPDTRPTSKEP